MSVSLLHRFTRAVSRHAMAWMVVSVLAGLLWQELARLLSPLVMFASIGTMYLTMVRLDQALLFAWLRRPAVPLAIVVSLMLVFPLGVLGLFSTGLLPPAVATAFVLMAATSPIISVGAYCFFLGTDNELLSLAVLPATAIGVLTLPLFAAWVGLPGLTPGSLALTLFFLVGGAMGGALLTRVFIARPQIEQQAGWLDSIMVVMMAVVAIGVTDGLQALIVQHPLRVVEAFVWTGLLNAGLQALGWVVFARFGRRVAASAALVNGFRNMALLLGVLLGRVDADLQLLLVAGQLQLFLLPSLMRVVYGRLGVAPANSVSGV